LFKLCAEIASNAVTAGRDVDRFYDAGLFGKLRLPIGGQNMLEGLTRDEVREFESLSRPAPVADEFEARVRDARWIDLYLVVREKSRSD
jgi:hypothetical protein